MRYLDREKEAVYRTKLGYIVKIVPDSINRFWKASTNDSDFFDSALAKLDWKSKEEAQKDLDQIALKYNLRKEEV